MTKTGNARKSTYTIKIMLIVKKQNGNIEILIIKCNVDVRPICTKTTKQNTLNMYDSYV